ncbi:MAG: hypothetical protein AAFU67_05955, partial [Bacteroidota bacterium]
SRIQRRNAFDLNGNQFRIPSETFQFQNLVLNLGGKQVFSYTKIAELYYTIALRVEYNLATNLSEYNDLGENNGAIRLFYPFDEPTYIRDITYGVTVGAGMDIPLGDKVGLLLQVTAAPDFSFQYDQPPIENVYNPYTRNNTTLAQRQIRNFTLELSAGFRFLRKIEYIEDF